MKAHLVKASTQVRDAMLAVIYPTACRVCGRQVESWRNGVACDECWKKVESVRRFQDCCWKCGWQLAPLTLSREETPRFCGRCTVRAFNFARACGPYTGAIRESVIRLKTRPQLSPRLNQLLRETFTQIDQIGSCDSIIPMPLHPTRLAERTFNQAETIARALSAATGLRIDSASVIRRKRTERHRVGMGVRERARSLAGAFDVRAPRLIAGRKLLVVDDVMTTGSTADEISRALSEAGAAAVNILTLARAVSDA